MEIGVFLAAFLPSLFSGAALVLLTRQQNKAENEAGLVIYLHAPRSPQLCL